MSRVGWFAGMAAANILVRSGGLKHVPNEAFKIVNGSLMRLYPARGAIHRDLFLYSGREWLVTDYLKRVGVPDVCLEVGANIGYYALLEAKLGAKKVYALEPVKSNFDLLRENVFLNCCSQVECFNVAAGRVDRMGEVFLSESANLCSLLKDAPGRNSEPVGVVSVDSFLHDRAAPGLIRMDVEGYELEVLRGMPETLRRGVDLLVEVHPAIFGVGLNDFLELLETNGYRAGFVAYETKVRCGKTLRYLYRIAGYELPAVYKNLSMSKLRDVILQRKGWCPNVLFTKRCNV